jgi:peptidoglycan/LPS O-acetylase OafA/YrhL
MAQRCNNDLIPHGAAYRERKDDKPKQGVSLKRIDQLDGIRAVAIVAVFLNHTLHWKMLWAGVDLFFILSGFLITGILIRGKEASLGGYFGHFYERRARRILPPLVLLLIVTTIFFGPEWLHAWYLYPFLMNFYVFLPHSLPSSHVVLWSLAVEEQFYLVWPIIVYFLNEKAIAWTAGVFFLTAPILRWLCTPMFAQHWQIYVLTPFRMDLMAAGAIFAVVWRKYPEKFKKYGVFGPVLTAVALAVFALLARNPHFTTTANTSEANVWVYELSLLASAGVVAWALSGRFVGVLTWAPVRYLGRISYSIYLIHITAIFLIERYWPTLTEHSVAAVAAVTVLLYAAASWHLVEKPILFWKPKSRIRREAEQDERAITQPQN